MANKGIPFERQICKELSNWWTDKEDDSCFWRTATSGARATVRSKQGKKTRGHYGDICATDDYGKPLTDLITFELKRGYSKYTLFDLFDAPPSMAQQKFGEWLLKAKQAAFSAGTPYWMIIHRRDGRKPYMVFPSELKEELIRAGSNMDDYQYMRMYVQVKHKSGLVYYDMTCVKMYAFLQSTDPSDVKHVLKLHEGL